MKITLQSFVTHFCSAVTFTAMLYCQSLWCNVLFTA